MVIENDFVQSFEIIVIFIVGETRLLVAIKRNDDEISF
jgi:hypothetical protein